MKIAIMQPTYFPWAGYFSLINHVDSFVFLDNVQFDRRSWQQRNQIAYKDKKMWITVPVKKKNLINQLIYEVKIEDKEFKKKHLKKIYHSYSKSQYFNIIYPLIEKIFEEDFQYLSNLNKKIIKEICNFLKINTKLINAKNLNAKGKKIFLLSNICKELKADEYVAVQGSKVYMEDHSVFKEKGILVKFYEYDQKSYSRGKYSFIPHLSILDLLFYKGPEAKGLIINEK